MKLKDLAEINSGYLFRFSIRNEKDGGVKVVQLKDVSNEGTLNVDGLYSINCDNPKRIDFLKRGDILFKAKSNKHVAALFGTDISNAVATAHFFVIRIKNEIVLPEYIAWYLNQRPAQIYFSQNASGSRLPVINKQLLGELEIAVPDKSIQEKIVEIYRLQRKERDLMKALEEKRLLLLETQLLSLINN